jgi:hypothetical protein
MPSPPLPTPLELMATSIPSVRLKLIRIPTPIGLVNE